VRAEFPIFRQSPPDRPLVYLDSAATSHKPGCVIDAVTDFYSQSNASVHRGVYELSVRATEMYEQARANVAQFLGAARPEEIIFVRGVTEAMNLLASSLGQQLKPGDEVIVTVMEHHSNLIPWQEICRQRGATLHAVDIDDRGELRMDEYARLLNSKTRIVAFTHISNVLGTVNPINEMVRLAQQAGAITVTDGAQAACHLPIDVQQIGCDYYAISGHKMYGPTGIGALYGKYDQLCKLPPYQTGGSMIESVTIESATWAKPPARFEAGTPNIAGAIGLAAAIDFLTTLGIERAREHEDKLCEQLIIALSDIDGVRVLGDTPDRAPVVSFIVDRVHPHDLATILDGAGVAVRAGHHCCQPLMHRLGITATTRASLGVYNQAKDIDALAQGIRHAIGLLQ
jgi:cysteine desulfurase / selenocysteine lyase